MFKHFKSMRMRTTLGFVVIVAVVLAGFIAGMTTITASATEQDNREMLNNFANAAEPLIKKDDFEEKVLALLRTNPYRDRNIKVIVHTSYPIEGSEDGRRAFNGPIWKSDPNMPTPPWPGREMRPQNRSGNESGFVRREPPREGPRDPRWEAEIAAFNRDWSYSRTRRVETEPSGARRFYAAYRSTAGIRRDQQNRKRDMIYLAGFIVFVVGIGGFLVVGRTLSPIRKLANQAADTNADELNTRLEPPSNDREVVELVDTLNGLLGRISDTAQAKGRFYAAASHELRTPLQALSGHLQLALNRERTAEEYRSALEEANRQSSRLKSLVQSLLLLHQLEGSQFPEQEPIDLGMVCEVVLQQVQPIVEKRNIKLSLDLPLNTTVMSVSNHADMIVRNLIENAVKYATEGGNVSVKYFTENGKTKLEVFDECELVEGWNPEKALEPFYRPDAARNNKTGGNGLGLAICRAIARANHWDLKVAQEGKGFRATVTFSQPEENTQATKKSKKTALKPATNPDPNPA